MKRAVIIGAGPAGLTAAYELVRRGGIHVVVLEKTAHLGGLSRTASFHGNRIDIGGHRFFSKSETVMRWWLDMLPVETPGAAAGDGVMLVRPRKSRIYYRGRLIDYPVHVDLATVTALGWWHTLRIGASYAKSALWPLPEERTLEEFFTNRFGAELYRTFFQSYSEKVWGVPCSQISAEWGAQRVQGLSVGAGVLHALKSALRNGNGNCNGNDLHQDGTLKTLIGRFLYPKLGPGQMWEEVARRVRALGGEIVTGCTVDRLVTDGWRIRAVEAAGRGAGAKRRFEADYFLSTAPVRETVRSLDVAPPPNVSEVAEGLVYRNFITVGLLVRSLTVNRNAAPGGGLIHDNWIYIQEPGVRMGRLQIYNNWSPALVRDPSRVWLGLEYFCGDADPIWSYTDPEMIALARGELAAIGFVAPEDVIDGTVLRMDKAYPAYCGTYSRLGEVRAYLDRFENLLPMGRNGLHRYNNQDHSMLTAMAAVDTILAGSTDKSAVWAVTPD